MVVDTTHLKVEALIESLLVDIAEIQDEPKCQECPFANRLKEILIKFKDEKLATVSDCLNTGHL